jgi:hypothetical protein
LKAIANELAMAGTRLNAADPWRLFKHIDWFAFTKD